MPRRRGEKLRRFLIFLSVVFILLALARFYPSFRHPMDSVLLIQSLFAGEEGGWLKGWAPVFRRPSGQSGKLEFDLYKGGSKREEVRGCTLLAHGMTDLGRKDNRLSTFAENIARLGFVVIVPELPGMRQFRPEEEDVSRIADSFIWMHNQYGRLGRRCGIFSFSFAVGPAMKAAAQPRLSSRVGYFIAVGPYFELKSVLRHITTGEKSNLPAFPGGPPVRVGKWLFLRYNLELLGLIGYENQVEDIIQRKLRDESADITGMVAHLPKRARKVLALIENPDPDQFEFLFRSQPSDLQSRLGAWSLRDIVLETSMPLFLIHGQTDPFVPFTESIHLAERARRRPRGEDNIQILVTKGFSHVDPEMGKKPWTINEWLEIFRVGGFVSRILTVMEGG